MPHPDPARGRAHGKKRRFSRRSCAAKHGPPLAAPPDVRSPLVLALLLLGACAAQGPRTSARTDDGAPALAATTTCTQANMESRSCEDLRRVALGRPDGETDTPNASVARALEWLDDGVMGNRAGLHRGYRADSKGLLAMAWAESADLADGNEPPRAPASTRLASNDDLSPGDALESHGHALLFGGWADADRTSAIVLTQPDVGPAAMHSVPRAALEAWTPVRRAGP